MAIDAFTRWTGKRLAWLILVAVVVSAVNAIVRKVFDTSSNSWLELQWVLFSIVFLLCSPWTLLDNEHIRIDIVNNMLPKKVRNAIDVVGPRAFPDAARDRHDHHRRPVLLALGRDQRAIGQCRRPSAVARQIAGHHRIQLLLVQGISELIKRIAVMRGLIPDPHASQVNTLEAEVEHLVEAMEKR